MYLCIGQLETVLHQLYGVYHYEQTYRQLGKSHIFKTRDGFTRDGTLYAY